MRSPAHAAWLASGHRDNVRALRTMSMPAALFVPVLSKPAMMLIAELPGRPKASTASSCWPLATLCERPLSCVPTTWLQASIFVRQSVARIVSPEGRLCAFAAAVIGVGAEGFVSGGAAM